MKKKLVSLFLSLLTVFLGLNVLPKEASASMPMTQTVDEGTISKTMNYADPLVYNYPNSSIGNYPATIYYSKDGYAGTLYASQIKLIPQDKFAHVVSGRTTTLTQYWTDSEYREFSSEVPVPGSYSGWYYDAPSGQNVWYSLPRTGFYPISNTRQWRYYRSEGRSFNYNKYTNYYLGFMSNSSYSYYAGRWTDWRPGEAPDKYYGIPRPYLSQGQWYITDYGWDEPGVVNADYFASLGYSSKLVYSNGSWWWRSESGRLNKYRRGVWIDYQLYLPVSLYQGSYTGTISLPDYTDYYYATSWKVSVTYTGTLYATNLTANSIQIVDTNNNSVDHLVKGKQYRAKITYQNSGETNVLSHYIKLYDNSTLITEKFIDNNYYGILSPNGSRTIYIDFTASQTGQNIFKAVIDSQNNYAETNEGDNEVSGSIYVNTLPTISLSYSPNPPYEGDNVTIAMNPSDSDGDPLSVTLQSFENGSWSTKYTQNNVASNTLLNYTINDVLPKIYQFKVIVKDKYNDTSQASLSFSVLPLTISGKVNHTDKWNTIHIKNGDAPNQYYSGEQFLVSAQVTDYPIQSVNVKFTGQKIDGSQSMLNSTLIPNSHPLYTGTILDPFMANPSTKLANGNVYFLFTATWKNGITKTDLVSATIIDDVFKAFNFHQTN